MAARRKQNILCYALFFLAASIILLCAFLQSSLSVDFQYVIPAPQETAAWASCYEQARELQASFREERVTAAIYGRKQHTDICTAWGQITVTLYAVDDSWREMFHETLFDGRLISERDVEREDACIVLNESSARTLFPAGDVLGNAVQINGTAYEVVGLIRDSNHLGEGDDGVCYVPITAPVENMDTVICSLRGDGLSGASAIYEEALRQWQPKGTFHNYYKIKWSAWMPFYLTAMAMLIAGLMWLFRYWKRWGTNLMKRCRTELSRHYLKKVLLRFIGRGFLVLCTGTVIFAGVWLLLQFMVLPMKLFTEWVPENPTNFSSLVERITYILRLWSAGTIYHSRESSQMSLSSSFLVVAYALLTAGQILFLLKRRK